MRVRRVEDAAEGIVRVVEGNMERAIRTITVQRGQDPRSAVLFPFGGAAGLHACGLAEEMGFPEILVPRSPGLLSAIGVLDGRVAIDRLVPLSCIDPSWKWLAAQAAAAARGIRTEVMREGFASSAVRVSTFVRARYLRQSIELEVPLEEDFRARFDDAHRALFHSADPARALEVVGLRVSGSGEQPPPRGKPLAVRTNRRVEPSNTMPVVFGGRATPTAIVDREMLPVGAEVRGPAVLTEYSSTTVVAPGWKARVDVDHNLRLVPA